MKLPGASALGAVAERLRAAGVPTESVDEGLLARDPANNRILLSFRRPCRLRASALRRASPYEADQFLRSVVHKSLAELKQDAAVLARAPWLKDFDLSRMGDEFFHEDNIKALLLSIKPDLDETVLKNIKGLLSAHVSRVNYMFQQRLKNLSFAVGVGLCLILDINAVTIWRTLYTHDQVRTAFASEAATAELLRNDSDKKTGDQNGAAPAGGDEQQNERQERAAKLAEARAQFGERMKTFTSEVNFGVGRVWRQTPPLPSRASWIYEFLGALMTGLLVSVGAPYWHDILESFGSLRKSAKA